MQSIVLIGFKASGKSTAGKALASLLGVPFIDTDALVETLYAKRHNEPLTCREIYLHLGAEGMRRLETEALEQASSCGGVVATGGGAVLEQQNRHILQTAGQCVFLDTPLPVLEDRLAAQKDSPLFREKSVTQLHGERYRLYVSMADVHVIPAKDASPEQVAEHIRYNLQGINEVAHGK